MTGLDLVVQFDILFLKLFGSWILHEHNRCWLLGLGGNSQFHSAPNVNIGNVGIFTHNWDVTDNISWGDICGQNDDAFSSLFDGFDHILNSPPEVLFSIEIPGELEDLVFKGVIGKGIGER